MKSFSEWVKESNPGNYVAVNVTGLPVQIVSALPGKVTPDPHITLMYSKNSGVPLANIDYVLKRRSIVGQHIMVTGVDLFDSNDVKTDSGEPTCCIVLKVTSTTLNDIHNNLIRLGCKHSYDKYEPHATLIYGAPVGQATLAKKDIEHKISEGIMLTCTSFVNNHIVENWAQLNTG